MAVFLSRRWKRQPQQPVGVDWGNPLTNRLSDVFAPTLGLRGAVSNIALTAVTSIPPIGAGRSGTGWTNSGLSLAGTDGVGLQAAKIYDTGGSNPITLFAVFEAFDAPSTSGNGAIVWSDSCMLQYHHASAPHQNCFDTYNSSDSWKTVKFSTPVANTIYVWVGTVNYPTASAYTNGVLSASATHSAGRTASTTNFFINTRSGGNNWNGRTYLAGVANRCWTAEEVASFSANPWQLFAPVRRRIFFDVGAATAYTLTTATGSFTETGNAATLRKGNIVLTTTGSFTETGNAANLVKTNILATATGAFTETGNAANLTKQWALVAGVGSFVFTGNDATLSYSGDTHPPLVAASGSYTLTGNATGLAHGYVLTTEVGTFSETGNAANLKRGNSLITETGSFILTGNDSTLTKASVLSLEKGTFIMTGRNANLIWSGAGGSTVEFFRGVSKAPDGGVSKTIHTLVDGGGGTYVVTESSGVSEDKTDSPNYEGYIIT